MKQVEIDIEKRRQIFEGWGTALCWWANVVGNWEDKSKVDEVCQLIFNREKGLGFNIVRYNFGSGTQGNPLFRNGANIPSYGIKDGEWDMAADQGQLNILKKAIEEGVDITEGFFNSPPVWMTKSGSTGGNHDGSNNLREDCYDQFVDYTIILLKKLEEAQGIKFHTLSLFNEPTSYWWDSANNQEGCHYSVESQNQIIRAFKKRSHELDLYDIIMSGAEGWSTYESVMMYHDYDQDIRQYIGQVNTHTYSADRRTRRKLLELTKGDHKKLYMSEVCYGVGEEQDQQSIETGLVIARNILEDMRYLQPEGWVYWQAIEDKDLQHNYGFLQSSFSKGEEYDITKGYYIMAQFSKYICPGDVILDCEEENVLCSYNENDKRVTVVIVNDKDEDIMYKITHMQGFKIKDIVRTSSHEDLQSQKRLLEEVDKSILCIGKSVTTLIFEQ